MPKGSFYNHFQSKEQFALAVLDRYQEAACSQMEESVRGAGSPLDRLRALFRDSRSEMAARRFEVGCLAGRLAQELAGQNPAFRAPLERTFRCMRSLLERLLAEAVAGGELPSDFDSGEAAEFVLNAWQGASLRAKSAHCATPLENFERVLFGQFLQRTP